MGTMLMGHGAVLTSEKVVVPDGLTISFLIDSGRVMPFANGVSAVRFSPEALMSEGFAMSSTHGGGTTIDNHELHVLSSDQRAWYAQVDPEDGSCLYAGEQPIDSPTRLCTDPDDPECAKGEHDCDGLFAKDWSDTDLYWVSCRQDGGKVWPQNTIGPATGNWRDATEFVNDAKEAGDLLAADPDGFDRFWDGLSEEDRVPYLYRKEIKNHVYQRGARAWLADDATTDRDFYAFVHGQGQDGDDIYLGAADLLAVYERGRVAHAAQEVAEFGLSVQEIDWSVVQQVNEQVLKEADEGDVVPYWQRPTGEILIGDARQAETYRKLLEFERDPSHSPTGATPLGHITVVARGGRLSSGEFSISGPACEDVARSWIGAFSKKKLTFTG